MDLNDIFNLIKKFGIINTIAVLSFILFLISAYTLGSNDPISLILILIFILSFFVVVFRYKMQQKKERNTVRVIIENDRRR